MNTTTYFTIDIREEVEAVLKTVLLLDRPYGATYVNRILRGDTGTFGLKKDAHQFLETFGELKEVSSFRLDNLIRYLIKMQYLQIKDLRYGTIAITEKAMNFLKKEEAFRVDPQDLRKSWYDVQLEISLKEIRKQMAKATDKESYEIFTNFTLQRLAETKPDSASGIRNMTACKHLSESQAEQIAAVVQDIRKKMERDEVDGTFRRVYSRHHRQTKSMYLEGKKPDTIASELNVEVVKVHEYLSDLHRAGELDLTDWIESQVEQQDFHRGTEYFRQAANPHLTEAHAVLGLDYDKLHMCRAYVTRVEEEQASYALAS